MTDRNGSCRIADFGLSLLAKAKTTNGGLQVEQCSGTVGYADPAYIASSVVTEKREVYSFGMVLLELLTGRPPALVNPNTNLVDFTYAHVKNRVQEILPMVQAGTDWPPEIASFWAQLALACVQESEAHRPSFVEIVNKLRKLKNHIARMVSVNRSPKLTQQAKQPDSPAEKLPMIKEAGESAEKKTTPIEQAPKVEPISWNPFDTSSPGRPQQTLASVKEEAVKSPGSPMNVDRVLDKLFGPQSIDSEIAGKLRQMGFDDRQISEACMNRGTFQEAVDWILERTWTK